MHIHPTGMAAPHLRLLQASRPRLATGMMLLHPYLAQLKTGGPQGPQQLMAVVLQGLQPGPRLGPHREPARLQPQRLAMGGQLGAGQPRPGPPQGRQVAVALPPLLELLQTAGQLLSWCWRRRHQHVHISLPPTGALATAGRSALAAVLVLGEIGL